MIEEVSLIGLFLIFFWHIMFMSRLGKPTFSRRKTVAIWSVSMAVMLITGYVLMYTVGMNKGTPILAVCSMTVALAVFLITASDSFSKKFFLLVTYYNLFYMIVQCGFLLSSVFYPPDTVPYQILSIIIRNIIQLITFVLYFKYVHPKLCAVKVQQSSEWWHLSVISILFTLIYITQAMMLNRIWLLPASYTPLLIAIFIQGMATFLAVFRTISYMNKSAESSLMEQKMKFLSEQMFRLMQSEEEIRSLRHDMNGHLSTLSSLLADGRSEEAASYLSNVVKLHEERKSEPICDDPYMNAVLSEYSAVCRNNDISFIYHIGVGGHSLPATELCLILNNALENAVEACMKLPKEDRKIKVQAAVKQNHFLLRVSNSFNGVINETEGLPVTEKEGKEHGYGLSNIIRAAQRRRGSASYHTENGYFVLDVEFPLT